MAGFEASAGDCRMFLTNAPFRAAGGSKSPVIVWLNLNSKQEVDELFERWNDTGAKIVEPVEDETVEPACSSGSRISTTISCVCFTTLAREMSEERR